MMSATKATTETAEITKEATFWKPQGSLADKLRLKAKTPNETAILDMTAMAAPVW